MYRSVILFSRHGRLRLSKWFLSVPEKERYSKIKKNILIFEIFFKFLKIKIIFLKFLKFFLENIIIFFQE